MFYFSQRRKGAKLLLFFLKRFFNLIPKNHNCLLFSPDSSGNLPI